MSFSFLLLFGVRGEPDPVSSSVRLIRAESRMGRRIKAPEIPHIPAYFMLHMSLECLCRMRERRLLRRWTRQKEKKVDIFKATFIADLSHFLDPRALLVDAGFNPLKS